MLWQISGIDIDPNQFGSVLPERVLIEHEGPRTFVCYNATGQMMLAHQCGEDDSVWRYVVVPFSDVLLSQLESGVLELLDALNQPWLWIVDIGSETIPERCVLTSINNVPASCLPESGVFLNPEHDPLLHVTYYGDSVDLRRTSLNVVSTIVTSLADSVTRLLQTQRGEFRFRPSELPLALSAGSIRISLFAPSGPNTVDAKSIHDAALILDAAIHDAPSIRRSMDNKALSAIRAALSISPLENYGMIRSVASGSLIASKRGSVELASIDRMRLRHRAELISARCSRSGGVSPVSVLDKGNIVTARNFWLETGEMNGTNRDWLELPDTLAAFFSPEDWSSNILIQVSSGERFVSESRERGHQYGQWQRMYRIKLPPVSAVGVEYPRKIVRFCRVVDSDIAVYQIDVTGPRSENANEWRARSDKFGVIDRTGGANGRQYGYW